MLKFKNRDHLPATPKSWKAPNGTKIAYDSVRQTWEQFVSRVYQYCDANGVAKPSEDELEDHICHQMSSWACIDASAYRAHQTPPKLTNTATRSVGCSSCNKRKKANA